MSERANQELTARIAGLSPEKRALLAERFKGRSSTFEPIAVIGIGCRFPGADGKDAFWELLRDGVDAVGEVPPDRWNIEALYSADPLSPGTVTTRWGGFLRDIDRFDAGFFGIAPREAMRMDPQQRLLLEVAWHAFEDAGQTTEMLAGSRTGVFVGIHSHSSDYAAMQFADPDGMDAFTATGTAHNFMSGRLSYWLDLQGPSLVVDTACSSSLVAVHLACQSLRAGECAMALAGGVNLMVTPQFTIAASRMHMLSPDGRCKAFDAGANGFVRSEGCGAVILKRLSDARAAGDRVLAVIRGTAVNQDGRTNGITAPNGVAQQSVIREALRVSGIDAAQVTYVEAHGTGTALGDPIEVESLGAVLGAPTPAGDRCALGSAKTNLGHLEGAAGIAGLIKVVLCLQHNQIPPVVHFRELNPHILIDGTRLEIPTSLRKWRVSSGRRIAGLSSFGWSGTNVHAIVEEAPADAAAPETVSPGLVGVFPLSAASPDALAAVARQYATWFESDAPPSLGDAMFSAAVRRSHFEHRLAIVGRSTRVLGERLRAYASGDAHPDVVTGCAAAERRGVAFVFPGQGSQWLGMGRTLLSTEPAFRASIEACDQAIRRWTGWSVAQELEASASASRLTAIDVVQPTLFAVQVALAALWRSWGIEPDAVVGHSMGEVAAAHVAGALTLDDAARIICRRSALLKTVSGRGAMAVLELSLEDTRAALLGREDRLAIAVSNGRRSTVVSGDPIAVQDVIDELQRRDVFCRPVKVDVASHSPQMDPLLAELRAALDGIQPAASAIPIYSTVADRIVDGAEFGAGYWVRNLREPVLFSSAIERLAADGNLAFVEIGPHPILLPAIETSLHDVGSNGIVVPSLRRDEDERGVLLESAARLHCAGLSPSWERLVPQGRFVAGPRYPFQRERFWLEAPSSTRTLLEGFPSVGADIAHPLLGPSFEVATPPGTRVWQPALNGRRHGFLIEHRVDDLPLLAASVSVELFLAAAAQVLGGRAMLTEVVFERPLVLDEIKAQLVAEPADRGVWRCSLFARTSEGEWARHASALAALDSGAVAREARPSDVVTVTEQSQPFYERFARLGVDIGPTLQVVASVSANEFGAHARLCISDDVRRQAGAFCVHPAILDGAFQTAAVAGSSMSTASTLRLAARIGAVRIVTAAPGDEVSVDVGVTGERDGGVSVRDACLNDPASGLAVELLGLELQAVNSPRGAGTGSAPGWFYHVDWTPRPRSSSDVRSSVPTRHGLWVVLGDRTGVAQALAERLERKGDRVACLTDPAGFKAIVEDATASREELRGVVHLLAIDATSAEAAQSNAPDQIDHAIARCAESTVAIVRELASRDWNPPPRLFLVSKGASHQSPDARLAGAVQAPIWGLGRVIAEEHREFWGALIDVGADADPAAAADRVFEEIWNPDENDQIAYRGATRVVARLTPWKPTGDGPAVRFRADGTYIISGGLGDVGLEVARWAAQAGAGRLVLLGRRALPAADAPDLTSSDRRRVDAVDAIRRLGCTVDVVSLDVADRDALTALTDRLHAGSAAPIRGVFHCAAVVDDRMIRDLDAESLRRVVRPKIHGAWLLHELLRDEPLDVFVMFSSFGSILGQAGQGSYAAANSFLDALAHLRRASGRCALTVNWGAWRGLGFAATSGGERTVRALEASGISSFDGPEGCHALGELLRCEATQVSVIPADWTAFRAANPAAADRPLLISVCAPAHGDSRHARAASAFVLAFGEAPADERRPLLETHLQAQLAAVLRVPASKIDPLRPLGTLGLESLLALEFRNRLERSLGLKLPATMVWNHPTVRALATYVAGRLGVELDGAAADARPAPKANATPAAAGVDDLSDEQALRALLAGR